MRTLACVFACACGGSGGSGAGVDAGDPPPEDLLDFSSSTIRRVSVSSDGVEGNTDSGGASISGDGRFVVFSSAASSLIDGDTNDESDCFLHDNGTRETSRVSVTNDGEETPDISFDCSISHDGTRVVFTTGNLATDSSALVVRDLVAGTTRSFVQGGRNGAASPRLSGNGRYVVYQEDALLDYDLIVYDLETDQTELVNGDASGVSAGGSNRSRAISTDGRFVLFESDSNVLVPDPSNDGVGLLIRDRQSGITERVVLSEAAAEFRGAAITDDGRYVAFQNTDGDLMLVDRQSVTSTNMTPIQVGPDRQFENVFIHMTAAGPSVVMVSYAGLVASDVNDRYDVYWYDAASGETVRVTPPPESGPVQKGAAGLALSKDGKVLVFRSSADHYVSDDTNDLIDVFVVSSPF